MKYNVQMRKTEELKPYENNPKNHPTEQIEKLADSIETFGFQQPIAVDEDNVVVIGHARLEAAEQLELEEVPCKVITELSEDEMDALRVADNKLSEQSEWSVDRLFIELDKLENDLVEKTGFDEIDLGGLDDTEDFALNSDVGKEITQDETTKERVDRVSSHEMSNLNLRMKTEDYKFVMKELREEAEQDETKAQALVRIIESHNG